MNVILKDVPSWLLIKCEASRSMLYWIIGLSYYLLSSFEILNYYFNYFIFLMYLQWTKLWHYHSKYIIIENYDYNCILRMEAGLFPSPYFHPLEKEFPPFFLRESLQSYIRFVQNLIRIVTKFSRYVDSVE